MAKRKGRIDKQLEQLSALLKKTIKPSDIKEVEKAIKSKNNVVAAKAAQVIKKHTLTEMIPCLVEAMNRFYEGAAQADKACVAKIKIIDTLNSFEYSDEDFYLMGLHYTQQESSWGEEIDTAAKIRGYCALALARLNYLDIHLELAELLMDNESIARIYAARALDYIGGERSELLLRMRILCPDSDTDNYGEYFSALISIDPKRSLPFVARYLDNFSSPLFDEAAFAIGSSRSNEAFEILKKCLSRPIMPAHQQRIIIVALTLLRTDQSIDYLISLIDQADTTTLSVLTETLDVFSEQKEIMTRITTAMDRRKKRKETEGNKNKGQTDGNDKSLRALLKELEADVDAGNFITFDQLREGIKKNLESITKKDAQKNRKFKK